MTASLLARGPRNSYALAPVLTPAETGAPKMLKRSDWAAFANCRNVDPDSLFVRGAAQRRAAEICEECPVLMNCRADALDNRVEFGVWGGLTERQRRAVLRKNPHVTNWAEFFSRGGEVEV